jgi:hypothetical protein
MFEEEMKVLLDKDWEEDEYKLISRLMENLVYYKRLMPKTLKSDIIEALELCNKLKVELDVLRKKIHDLNNSI